jgi:hypothetical protein
MRTAAANEVKRGRVSVTSPMLHQSRRRSLEISMRFVPTVRRADQVMACRPLLLGRRALRANLFAIEPKTISSRRRNPRSSSSISRCR